MAVLEQPSQRRSERKDCFRHISGTCQGTSFYATLQNLSVGGLCFETDYLFRTGQRLRLSFKTPPSEIPLSLKAEVVWTQPMHMLFHRVGVKFEALDTEAESAIAHLIQGIESASPNALSSEEKYPHLLGPFESQFFSLKNHVTMAPMFWGYANKDGTVSRRLINTYREIASGGAAMIVVANAVVHPSGLIAPRTIRVDDDRFIPGLARLAGAINKAGAVACLQINHGGRWAEVEKPLTPSPLTMGGASDLDALDGIRKDISRRHQLRLVNKFLSSIMKCRKEMPLEAIHGIQKSFAMAASRAKTAGFDMVELHGATGYLLTQFISPRSNRRTDDYGGTLENRMRFPLQVMERVKTKVGERFPVGYRFLADEWIHGGFNIKEAQIFAEALGNKGVAYLSVTAGTYESFFLPENMNRSRKEGYAGELARQIKAAARKTPVIVAGRIVEPSSAEAVLAQGEADLIGMARTLFADPQWLRKVEEGREEELTLCKCCNTCLIRAINHEPVVCVRWDKVKRTDLKLDLENKKEKWDKILLAVDDSENSLEAVEYAGHMIGPGKKITLFSLVNTRRGNDEQEEEDPQRQRQSLLTQAKNLLQSTGIDATDIQTKTAVISKNVEQDLLQELQSGGYGSVILGRKGASRTHQMLFGSISNYIVHHAKNCGVWVVD